MKIIYNPPALVLTIKFLDGREQEYELTVPTWADYVAFDQNGLLYAYEEKPTLSGDVFDTGSRYELICELENQLNDFELSLYELNDRALYACLGTITVNASQFK